MDNQKLINYWTKIEQKGKFVFILKYALIGIVVSAIASLFFINTNAVPKEKLMQTYLIFLAFFALFGAIFGASMGFYLWINIKLEYEKLTQKAKTVTNDKNSSDEKIWDIVFSLFCILNFLFLLIYAFLDNPRPSNHLEITILSIGIVGFWITGVLNFVHRIIQKYYKKQTIRTHIFFKLGFVIFTICPLFAFMSLIDVF